MTTDDLATRMYREAATPKTPSTAPGASSGQSTARTPSPRESAADRAGATSDRVYAQAEQLGRPERGQPASYAAPAPVPAVAPGQMTVEQLVGQELSLGDRMAEQAQVIPDGAEGYNPALQAPFSAVAAAFPADQAALDAGQRDAAEVLAGWRVPTRQATEIVRLLGGWHSREPLADDALEIGRERTEAALRQEWGASYQSRMELAQRAAREACQRLPWLGDLIADGAGNDVELVKHFAQIGLRSARRARR